jgi:hypothetical protein
MTALKTFTIVAALLASGTSLAMAQNDASSVSGDLVLTRLPNGAAAYTGSTAPVIRHYHTTRHDKHLYMTTRQHRAYSGAR